ncbi:MAG: gas vesicle protein GvpG [Deltaproteobacteria bacterium]|nr:gas vesicle protein GvpG [Deltaproteobacteria bacterium]
MGLGLLYIVREIAARVEQELWDDGAVREALTELYLQLERGAVTEEQFGEREAELVAELERIEQHREERGADASR